MDRSDTFEGRFAKRLFRPMAYAAKINDDGLVFGAGTVLARMTRDDFGAPVLALEDDKDRVLALLAAAFGRPPSPHLLRHLHDASAHWRRGDKALANIRLAFASMPRLNDRAEAYRLFLAEELLDQGMSPQKLMKELSRDAAQRDLAKYDPNQPRVPAGSGRTSGQWASQGAGAASAPKASAAAPLALPAAGAGTLAEGLFAPAATGSRFLAAVAALGEGLAAPAIILGAIFIPSPNRNRVISEGRLPGDSNLSYVLDQDIGVLSLYRQGAAGREFVTEALGGRDGIFRERETGAPIARSVGGSVIVDAASLDQVVPKSSARAGATARSTDDKPKLCPDPGWDTPHGASENAWRYQEQISALNNPQRPLLRGEAVSLTDPKTEEPVAFDDCRESDGAMIEAKGPTYAKLVKNDIIADNIRNEWRGQADSQLSAAGSRNIEWYFAEPEAAAKAEEWFRNDKKREKIKIIVVPAKEP